MMVSKTVWINLLLVGLLVFFSVQTWNVWVEDNVSDLPKPASTLKTKELPPELQQAKPKMLPESAYRIIPENNLFSPERTETVIQVEKKVEETEPEPKPLTISGQRVTLYGVILMGKQRSALISNPVRGPDEPSHRWVKLGQRVGDLQVAKIDVDRIELKDGKDTYEILLHDKKKSNRSDVVRHVQQPNVVITESEAPATKPQKTPAIKVKPKSTGGDSDEYEIVSTPFGKFKRKKKK